MCTGKEREPDIIDNYKEQPREATHEKRTWRNRFVNTERYARKYFL